ncbi:hypothetical protein [Streptomyces sp. NPDC050485]|uniref:hypothetical protein n=1 Tax=Streptomyces sp. NPDC050485 TaxID=3365617 RepID=UPI00378BAB37
MTDDGRGADVITLPMPNLAPPGSAPDDEVPPPPTPGDLAPPPDFFLPFSTPGDGDDPSTVDPDDVAPQMVANASSGTGTPARATASMAMVTMAAIAVAALRGTWSVANYLKARREHHDAVADKAREAADKQKVANTAAGAKKGVQPAAQFGRGATGKGGGRSGGSGAGGGSGRGTFGQQQKPAPKGGGRGSTANGSTGAGGRGSGSGAGPKGSKNGTAGSGSRTSGSGSSGRGSKGAAGGGTGSSGSGSSKGSPSGAKKSPGTLGKLATGRQQRKNDDAKAQRQAAADQRKADLADRAAARKEAAAEAADRRKRKAEKRKAKREREKAGGTGPKDPKETGKGKPDEKVDLTKKPEAGDGTGAKKDDTEKVDLTKKPKAGDGTTKKDDTEKVDLTKKPKPGGSKGGTKKTPKVPPKKKPRSWRRKPKGSTTGPKTRRRRRTDRSTSGPGAMPGGDGEWLRPPPGWDVSYKVDLEVIRPEPRRRQPAGITTGRRELPAGSSGQVTPTRSVPKESPIVMGTAVSVGEVGDTQFVDADLTVYDLIESDEEMGEQILQGVDHMNLVASKCEGLKSGLESLYAMCIEKKVPGVLVKWCIRLMERAGSVQDKAEALRDSLPRASEAILSARDTAVEADKLRADRVKEAGHVAPAEREYHDRSGA